MTINCTVVGSRSSGTGIWLPSVLNVSMFVANVALAAGVEARPINGAAMHVSALRFEPNVGQMDNEALFFTRGSGWMMFLTPDETIWRLSGGSDGSESMGARTETSPGPAVLRMRLRGADDAAVVRGVDPLPSRSHYFRGQEPRRWVENVPHFGRAVRRNVYSGVDVVYRSSGARLEFDFVLQAGVDPGVIVLDFDADRIEIDSAGLLRLHVGSRELTLTRPDTYQEVSGHRRQVHASYVLTSEGFVGIHVAGFDPDRSLVIDPVVIYSTYLGGAADDSARAIDVDEAGNAYIVGATESPDFPTGAARVDVDAFVAKLDVSGTNLLYTAFFGGAGRDLARGVALDHAGNVHVSGATESNDFPTVGALQSALAGDSDAFVLTIPPSGSTLLYSTYLGGSQYDAARGLVVDREGNRTLMGQTLSTDFPVHRAVQPSHGGALDAFVTQLDPSGTQLVFSTFHGGSGNDLPFHTFDSDPGDSPGWGLAADPEGFVYVAGTTESTDFPTVNALQDFHGGGLRDAFISKFAPTGSSVVYSTLIGRAGGDTARGIDVDDFGNAYVTGATRSADFPVTPGAFQTVKSVLYDAFVLKLDPSGALVYSTLVGGNGREGGNAIEVDMLGNAYVFGHTESSDFPLREAVQPLFGGGGIDTFLFKLNATASELVFSTYLGGSDIDTPEGWNMGLALDAIGNVYVAGSSASVDFLVTPSQAIQEMHAGGFDAVVSKLRTEPEIALSLLAEGPGDRLILRLRHPGVASRSVELKFWIHSEGLGDAPFSLVSSSLVLELGPTGWFDIADAPLPASVSFPGTSIGAALVDPVTGMTLSATLCDDSPCN